jgi:aldehyde dehydrogenase (NAD+)
MTKTSSPELNADDPTWRYPVGERRMLIAGELVEAHSGAVYENVAPALEEPIGVTADGGLDDLNIAIGAARRAFDETDWSRDHDFRRHCLHQLIDAVEGEVMLFRRIDSAEAGRPFSRTPSSIDRNIATLRLFAELAGSFEYESRLEQARTLGSTIVRREPFGVVAGVFTWNCGFYLNIMKIGASIAAGNTIVARPAPETPWQTTTFGRLIAEKTDIPAGVVNIVSSSDARIAAALTGDPRVDVVNFTGSTNTGRLVAAQAAPTIKKLHMELGGKSASIVLDDAEMETAIARSVALIYLNAGQSCAATTRLLLPRSRYEEGIEAAHAALSAIVPGDPFDPTCGQGPQISARQRDRVLAHIEQARPDCRLVLGGGRPTHVNRGYFVEPTIFADVDPLHPLAQTEVFGPVLAIIPYDNEEQAVAIANNTIYGLSGAVHSASTERAVAIARRLRTGHVAINGAHGDGPFGGYKQSGIGREAGVWAFDELLQIKSIGLHPAGGT